MEFKNIFTLKNVIFLFFILFIIFCIVKMTDVALLVFASYVISCAINPYINKLSEKIPRSAATLLMITIITLVTLGVFIPIIGLSVREIKDFVTQLPQQVAHLANYLDSLKIGAQSLSDIFNLNDGLSNSTQIIQQIIDKSINFTVGVVGVITILVTIGIIVYFFSNDRDKIKECSLKLFPSQFRENASRVMDDLEIKVGGYVTAQILSISIVGIVVAVCLLLMHVPYAIFLGFISAILDLVPIVGPVLSGVLILLVAFPKGILISVLAICSLLLGQFLENNWAKPYFFSKYMDLHPLVVIFSFVIAAKVLGVIGVLLAPAIAAVIVTLFEEIYVKTMNNEGTN